MSTTLHIAGAGPAGLAAAITAARAGQPVVVHEQASTVGARFHDDFQGLENWTTSGDVIDELASFGIGANFDCTPLCETVIFDPTGRPHTYRTSRPLYYLVRRGPGVGTLDSGLRAQAERAGVTIRFNEASRHLPQGGIVAAGPHSPNAIAVGYVFETDMPDGAYGAVADRLAPKGYAYVLVHGRRGTVATTLFEDFHNEKTYLARTVEFFEQKVGLRLRTPRRFGGMVHVAVQSSARRGNLLFAGEAAGFQDALWGFGMRYAIVSGHLAAIALLNHRPEDYDFYWSARFRGLLRTGMVNRYLYEKLGDSGYAAFTNRIDRASDARSWLRRQYGPSVLKRALLPLARRAARIRMEAICVMENCDCTWCRCQHTSGGATEAHEQHPQAA